MSCPTSKQTLEPKPTTLPTPYALPSLSILGKSWGSHFSVVGNRKILGIFQQAIRVAAALGTGEAALRVSSFQLLLGVNLTHELTQLRDTAS